MTFSPVERRVGPGRAIWTGRRVTEHTFEYGRRPWRLEMQWEAEA